jgi:hypothetical protein
MFTLKHGNNPVCTCGARGKEQKCVYYEFCIFIAIIKQQITLALLSDCYLYQSQTKVPSKHNNSVN